ncbi:bile acid:sodium symporter [Desulfosarcina variabilis]|uniref:bile acid:sodium symporter n=1 Tax=Desulfosarcina variabilis TaxID=2300 RepID=UPI003AFA0DDB
MKKNMRPSLSVILSLINRYWFLTALFSICLITVVDGSGILAAGGKWLKLHRGPDLVVVLIFFFSGLALSPEQLKKGLMDVSGILLALVVIFIAAPLIAVLFSLFPMGTGIVIGLFMVAVMPSTLSSGVVMTAAAGGRPAHALVITIVANVLSVFTIPVVLSLLLAMIGQSAIVSIDKAAIMIKIGILVVSPLAVGMLLKHFFASLYHRIERKLTLFNQCLILFIVWIAMSQTHALLVGSGLTVALIVIMVFAYHGLLLLCGWGLICLSGRQHGQWESVLFMGCQKTLPLSVILQMSLFPQYGIALLVCVLHHVVHLMMDGYLVERLRK